MNKIEVTNDFLTELIDKSWQESEAIQQQISNIDDSTKLGSDVIKLLKNTRTAYYVLIGCLETLAENPNTVLEAPATELEATAAQNTQEQETAVETTYIDEQKNISDLDTTVNFEPFEYFVDFDEPSGAPISDQDLYG
jgi:hypothetical protein